MRSPIGPYQLRITRSAQESLLNNLATVRRYTTQKLGSGGTKESWVNAETYFCLVQQKSSASQEGTEASRVAGEWSVVIKMPWNAQIGLRDRIVVDSQEYNIQGTNSANTNRLTLECYCTAID